MTGIYSFLIDHLQAVGGLVAGHLSGSYVYPKIKAFFSGVAAVYGKIKADVKAIEANPPK